MNALLIEDELPYQALLQRLLIPDFQLRIASTLAEGVAALQAEQPDVILLDVGLPDGKSHDETVQEVKKHRTTAAVVIISGNDDPEFRRACIKGTCSGYIVKGRGDRDPDYLRREIQDAVENHKLCRQIEQLETPHD